MKANEFNLVLYFRLIVCSIFQPMVKDYLKSPYSNYAGDRSVSYDNTLFFVPRVWAKDGWNVSLQIHNGNYCSTENGYREFGLTYERVEWGFPSTHESMLEESADGSTDDVTGSVGSIEVSLMEEIFAKHEGIDWETTLSIDNMNKFIHRN